MFNDKNSDSCCFICPACSNINAASIFGEQRKLEPMPPERKARWRKEINWLLSVTDHIVEFVPSQQKSKEGVSMEVIHLFHSLWVVFINIFPPFALRNGLKLWDFSLITCHDLTDYGDKAKKWSTHGYPRPSQTWCHAYCKYLHLQRVSVVHELVFLYIWLTLTSVEIKMNRNL